MSEKETIRVRIAVLVTVDGRAYAAGGAVDDMEQYLTPEHLLDEWGVLDGLDAKTPVSQCWVEVDVPLPEPVVVPVVEGKICH